MSVITFEDYTAAIKVQYEEEKSGMYSGFLLNPTPAQLRNLCLLLFDNGLNKTDENVFILFFQVKEGHHLRKCIENFDVEKFKAVKNFITGKNAKTNSNSLNLIAVLVNFQPRPFSKFLHEGQTDLKKISKENLSEEEYIAQNISYKKPLDEKNTLDVKKPKGRHIAIAVGVVGMIIGGYGVKKELFPAKECLQWNIDHYEAVICGGSKIGFAGVNPIFDKDESLLNFKKIEVSDTTTFFKNDQPIVWYIKQNGECEYFNSQGLHPISGKPLRPISKYIIKKYILENN